MMQNTKQAPTMTEARQAPRESFRDEVRTWLSENLPRESRPRSIGEAAAFDRAWQRRQFDGGWAGIAWPKQYGGRGLSLLEQVVWHEECARAKAPYLGINYVGVNHAGPTLMVRGSDAQKEAHLRPILTGESAWCQGFSEPEAGSDLGSLRTRGVVEGDHLVVTGQKIWTSYAQFADLQELLVLTDPGAPKHKGITWIICDMRLPGVDVRPIRTLTGEPEYCAVFYDNVRIPLANVVGGINRGWEVAMATLGFERGTGFIPFQIKLSQIVDDMHRFLAANPDRLRHDPSLAQRLAETSADVAAMRAMAYRGVARANRTDVPGPEGAMLVLFYGELNQRMHLLAMDLMGEDALELQDENWSLGYLESLKDTIGGGTSEIRRNIIAERVLGLPR